MSHPFCRPLLLLAVIALALAAPFAHAQQPPQPAPEIRRLTALAGSFEGPASFTTGGRTFHFTLRHTNTVIAGGFGLAAHEEADIPGVGHYEAENLFGWDAERQRLHLLTVTNDPVTHDHVGAWTDAAHVTLRYEGMRGGKRLVEVIPMELVGTDEYRFRSTTTVAGGAPEVFVADLKRVATASK